VTRAVFVTKMKTKIITFYENGNDIIKLKKNENLSKLNIRKCKLFKTVRTKMRLIKLLIKRL